MEVFRKFTKTKWGKIGTPHTEPWREVVFKNKYDSWQTAFIARICHRNKHSYPNFQADVLGSDIKTSGNKLSIWATASLTDTEIKCIAGGMMSNLEKYYIVKFDLDDSLFEFSQSNGATGYTLHRDKHYDVINLEDTKMHELARVMQSQILNQPDRVISVERKEYKELLREHKDNFCLGDFPAATSDTLKNYFQSL